MDTFGKFLVLLARLRGMVKKHLGKEPEGMISRQDRDGSTVIKGPLSFVREMAARLLG